MKKARGHSPKIKAQADMLAKVITLHCVRNTSIENLHSGTFPSSQTGDYSDVKVVTPFGEIPWNEASRISNEEMKRFNIEVSNKIFTFLVCLQYGDPPIGKDGFHLPQNWSSSEIDAGIES